MQYLAHEFNDNTIRFVLHYPGRLEEKILARAVQAVVSSVDVLHASFAAGHTTAYWHMNAQYAQTDYFTALETERPTETAIAAALAGIAPESKTQMHCTLAKSSRETARAVRISHLCVDGGDGKYLLEKICEAYNLLLRDGHTQALQVKNGSRAAEQMYEHLNSHEVRSLLKNPMTGVKTIYPFADAEAGERRLVGCRIEREEMQRIRARARERKATFNDVLLAACYQALADREGADRQQPISVMSMMDLRRYCPQGESKGLCNMAGSMPTALRGRCRWACFCG